MAIACRPGICHRYGGGDWSGSRHGCSDWGGGGKSGAGGAADVVGVELAGVESGGVEQQQPYRRMCASARDELARVRAEIAALEMKMRS